MKRWYVRTWRPAYEDPSGEHSRKRAFSRYGRLIWVGGCLALAPRSCVPPLLKRAVPSTGSGVTFPEFGGRCLLLFRRLQAPFKITNSFLSTLDRDGLLSSERFWQECELVRCSRFRRVASTVVGRPDCAPLSYLQSSVVSWRQALSYKRGLFCCPISPFFFGIPLCKFDVFYPVVRSRF